jgi:hypothetical protein
MGGGGALGIEDDLDQTVAVTEVDEEEAAVVATAVEPALEHDSLADVGGAQLSASVGASHPGPALLGAARQRSAGPRGQIHPTGTGWPVL